MVVKWVCNSYHLNFDCFDFLISSKKKKKDSEESKKGLKLVGFMRCQFLSIF